MCECECVLKIVRRGRGEGGGMEKIPRVFKRRAKARKNKGEKNKKRGAARMAPSPFRRCSGRARSRPPECAAHTSGEPTRADSDRTFGSRDIPGCRVPRSPCRRRGDPRRPRREEPENESKQNPSRESCGNVLRFASVTSARNASCLEVKRGICV